MITTKSLEKGIRKTLGVQNTSRSPKQKMNTI